MENTWPLWALPFWTMGIPLIWAVVEKYRSSKSMGLTTNFGVRPMSVVDDPSPVGSNVPRAPLATR